MMRARMLIASVVAYLLVTIAIGLVGRAARAQLEGLRRRRAAACRST